MLYTCEDEGGTTLCVEAETPQEAAEGFCEQTVDVYVEDLPDTIMVTVTDVDGKIVDVPVDLVRDVTFKAQKGE